MRLEFLPADVAGLSGLARAAASGRLGLPGSKVALGLADVTLAPAGAFEPEARAHLARWLESRLAAQRPHVAALEAVRALARPDGLCVLATLDPGPFGGTLSELWKAIAAIGLARALAERSGRPVVPLAWIAADGPLAGYAHPAWVPNHHGDLQRLGLPNLPPAAHPAAEVVLDAERQRLPALRALLAQLYGDHDHVEEALELCAPRAGETVAGNFARVLATLFGAHGLVWVEPSWLREELSHALVELVARDPRPELAEGDRLLARGEDASEAPHAEEPLVLRAEGGRLRLLRAHPQGFRFDDEPGARTAAELAAAIVQEPAAWAAGPALLPLVQERVLPIVARVGEEAELAREVRLSPLRVRLALAAPAFARRNSVTLVDAECERALERLGSSALDVLRERGASELESADAAGDPVAHLRAVTDAAVADLLACRAALARLDPAFSAGVKRAAERLRGAIDDLTAKAEHARANRGGTRRRHGRRLSSFLMPHGELQERVLGPFPFIARHGCAWIDELISAHEPFASEHLVVHLAQDAVL